MYLARQQINQKTHYFIRESFFDGRIMRSRDLFDLGREPQAYIIYPGDGPAFYFDEELCEALEALGVAPDNDRLERLFRPFLDPAIRRTMDKFSRPPSGRQASLAEPNKRCQQEQFQLFDQRRLHFLKFGEMEQTGLGRLPRKMFRKLLDKSRDEIEQQFLTMEEVLQPPEKKNYAYTVFNVSRHFESPLARQFPQALDQEKVDACFLEEVCRLNSDAGFWADLYRDKRRHQYLGRYVCWFFDHDFEGGQYLDDMVWQFKRRHHHFQPPPRRQMPLGAALRVLEIEKTEFDEMTIKKLTRQYRRLAKQYHPDQGGRHERFIQLNQAFEELLRQLEADSGQPHSGQTKPG
ncbi:MAG: DnaJ domain-containing protein [Desulfosudaceae bacterium]